MSLVVSAPEEWEDSRYAAEMTGRQFRALAARLHGIRLLRELEHVPKITSQTRRAAPMDEVRQWLFNGWNTENLLRLTSDLLKDQANASALHWSFPQAYYAAYSLTFAWFKVAGNTERTHAAVIKKFGSDVAAGEYPPAMSFYAVGTKQNMSLEGVSPASGETTLEFDVHDPASVDKQIAQFLRGTRRRSLDEQRGSMQFRNVLGRPKKRLSEADWEAVAPRVGATSLLSLLYRKRIQANYRDIDSLAFSGADAAATHADLLRVTTALNFVHECFIAVTVGWESYQPILKAFLEKCPLKRLARRAPYVRDFCL